MIQTYESKLNKAKGRLDVIKKEAKESRVEAERMASRMLAIEQALLLVQRIAQQTQQQLVLHIQDVVNAALDTCFPGEYEFQLVFEIKRNKTEARLVFLKNGFETDPLTENGGGVVDIASFALRIAAWSLGRTGNVICLDEPMKWLSRDYQPRAGEILSEISKKLNLQIIMVSHIPDIIDCADRIFEVTMKNKVSTVTTDG